MKKSYKILVDSIITISILVVCFITCLVIQNSFVNNELIPAVFVLGVFLISVITHGYTYGVISATISVLAVNFAFAFPLFAFNFTIPENILSAIILFVVTIVTCSLTTQLKRQEAIKAESEKETDGKTN